MNHTMNHIRRTAVSALVAGSLVLGLGLSFNLRVGVGLPVGDNIDCYRDSPLSLRFGGAVNV
ncbi:hypothetical protein ACFP51_28695 [Streptomyces pratens]|uniref:Uncharacterized protein n=1 Tax=Streptomyces pratens TaxID=887456 RepID=A0ABW1LZK6_9ACTN